MTPVWARKSTLVLLIVVLALAVFGTTTQTWITVSLDANQLGQAAGDQHTLPVQGSKAATTVTALAVVALAGGLAASIAGMPFSICLTMFSSITIASSTTKPTHKISAIIDKLSRL